MPLSPADLARLKQRYAAEGGQDVHDPLFRRVVDTLFTAGKRRKPYADVSTFLDLPLMADAAEKADFGGLDIALVGVPMDLGVTNRAGARLGPRAVRAVERIGPFHEVHRTLPMGDVKAADIGDVPFASRYDLVQSHADIEAFCTKLHAAGVRPLSVGGDHSMTLPILRALGRDRPVGMVHIDAHCDTSGAYEGTKFHHGGPFRQAVLDGVLDPTRTIQIGIRGNAEFIWEFSKDSGMTVIHAEAFWRMGVDAAVADMRRVIGDGPVYISFDIDSLDPAFAPGTGTPEAGGLQTREAMALVRGCMGMDVIGGDVVEVAPMYDATTNTAQAAAQMLFEIFAVMAARAQQDQLRKRPA
jgi:guanidinopropionase